MVPCLAEVYGNASSIHHFGQMAKQSLETARRQIAALIGCQPQEVVFVSGGTEADNLALFGTVRQSGKPTKHVITTSIQHPAVLNACAELQRAAGITSASVARARRMSPACWRWAAGPSGPGAISKPMPRRSRRCATASRSEFSRVYQTRA